MDCDFWQDKVDAFVDNELSSAESRDFESHLRECPACSAETLARQRLKVETRAAGLRYTPSPELQAKIEKSIARKPTWIWQWLPVAAGALAMLVAAILVGPVLQHRAVERQIAAQLVDQHVATLASVNPVDILSNDSHNVKPWFNGKVPFSVDIPNLQNTQYTLIGGKFAYFQQAPAAQLLFAVRKHKISVFMFRDHGDTALLGNDSGPVRRDSFVTETWVEDGVRYFAISDVNADDVRKLCEMLRTAS